MAKAVLVQSSSSIYDDDPGRHYHFPRRYLKRMQECQGDWAVFFAPVKDTGVSPDSRGAYTALARLGAVRPDLKDQSNFYIDIQPGTYASFASLVPRIIDGSFVEPAMLGNEGKANTGVALQSVRHISDENFDFIVARAWLDEPLELPRVDSPEISEWGVADEAVPFVFDASRATVATLLNRKMRDRRFRLAVLNAYGKQCAITGWQFVNGGGRAEAEAAHIKPVEHDGPDSINNGIAMSGTVHWMFDRGLIGVSDNDEILISRKVNDVDRIRQILNPTGALIRPRRPEHQPHRAFLSWHRQYHNLSAA